MDKAVIRAFSRAAETYDENSIPQQELWQELLNVLRPFNINTKAILDIGMGTGRNTYELAELYPGGFLVGFDIAWGMVSYAKNNWVINPLARIPRATPVDEWQIGTSPHWGEQKRTHGLCPWGSRKNRPIFLQADLEALPFKDESFDLVVSNAVFQRIGNLESAFCQINRILKPKGIFCLSLFSQETLFELKSAFVQAYRNIEGINLPLQEEHNNSLKIMEGLKFAAFNIIQKLDFKKKQYYKNPEDIVRWLKTIGATHHFKNWIQGINGRRVLQEMDKIYKKKYSEDSNIYATFESLIIKAEKPL